MSASRRRPRWLCRVLIASLSIAGLAYLLLIEGFLCKTSPVAGELLVVESWFAEKDAMLDAANIIIEKPYRQVLCVAMVDGQQPTPAERAARRLAGLGVNHASVHVLDVPRTPHDRTYACAVAVREWLARQAPDIRSLDVFTINVHARKSHVLFKKAFPPGSTIGIIPSQVRGYPFSFWWLSPRGIYVTVRNTLGYLYAMAFTPPHNQVQDTNPR